MFPCKYSKPCLLVSHRIPPSSSRQGLLEQRVCDTVLASLCDPCTKTENNFSPGGEKRSEVPLSTRQSTLEDCLRRLYVCTLGMTSVDLRDRSNVPSSGHVGTSPKSRFPSVTQISNDVGFDTRKM